MPTLDDALATIGATLPEDVRKAHLNDRNVALANSAQALILDLGVEGLPVDQQVDTELQVVRIADEITRLQSLADLTPVEVPQQATLTRQVKELTARVDGFAVLAVELATKAGVDAKEAQELVDVVVAARTEVAVEVTA